LTSSITYEYELREGDAVIATGRLTVESPLLNGDRVAIGKRVGVVSALLPAIADRDRRVVVRIT
jgi:hypothetical protein